MIKIALVTGGTRGIGKGIANGLGKLGYDVIITGTNANISRSIAIEISKEGTQVVGMQLDLASRESISALVKSLKSQYSKLDLLVNNAAILLSENKTGNVLSLDFSQLEQIIQVNFLGQVDLTHQLIPLLNNGSQILNVVARPALFNNLAKMTGMPFYRLSKLAFYGWAIMLAEELKSQNKFVTTMHPGWVKTDMGGPKALRTIEECVDTILWLVENADMTFTGKFYMDRKELTW